MQRHSVDRRLIASSALACACAAALDPLLAGAGGRVAVIGASLGAAVGTACGAALATVLALLGRARRARRAHAVAVWCLAGLALAWWLQHGLGATPRLLGAERALAWLALAASALAGAACAGLGLALQPTAARPRGLLLSAGTFVRRLVLAALLVSAAAGTWLDRAVEIDAHAHAHAVLRAMSLAALAAALRVALGDARWSALPRRTAVATLLALGAAFAGALALAAPAPARGAWHALLSRPYSALLLRAGRAATDLDADGYSGVLGGGDCAPWHAGIHPAAEERPGNGLDDNCLRGDAAPRSAPEAAPLPRRANPAPSSVVLITIDALSPAHLSAYGYRHQTTPALARWAARALRFDRAYSPAGWTTIALASLMRGLYPRALRWTRVLETTRYRLLLPSEAAALRRGERPRKGFSTPLRDPRPTLPAQLAAHGVATSAVLDDGYTQVLESELSAITGFAERAVVSELARKRANDVAVTATAVRALVRLRRAPTFFLWVHYFGPHHPDTPHPGVARFASGAAAGYDHEIARVDRELGLLLGAIEREQQRRKIAVLVSSDHGEVVRAGWRGHGRDLGEATLRIPLLLQADGAPRGTSSQLVSLLDVMPTVLDLTGVPQPAGLHGASLLELAQSPRRRVLISDTWRQDVDGRPLLDLSAAYDGRRKLVRDRLAADEYAVDQRGPGEHELPLSAAPPAELRAVLHEYLERHGALRFVP